MADKFILGFPISEKTASSVLFQDGGNVGIGTTTPSQVLDVREDGGGDVFRGIQVHNSSNANARAGISFKAYDWVQSAIWHGRGTASAYSGALVFGTNPNTSDLSVDGVTGRMWILNNGNVGIGTDSPGAKLEITGSTPTAGDTTLHLRLPVGNVTAGTTEMGNILFSSTDASGGGSGSIAKISTIAGIGSSAWLGQGRPTDLAFFTQPLGTTSTLVEAMRIDQDGNVGIGTDSPSSRVSISLGTGSSLATTFLVANNFLQIGTNDYKTTTSNGVYAIGFGYSSGATNSPAYIGLQQTGTGNSTKGDLVFRTRDSTNDVATTERMRINSAGNVGIGTGTAAPAAKLEISSTALISGDARYELLITEDNTASAGRGGGLAFSRQGTIFGGIKTLQNTNNNDNTTMYFQTRGSGVVSNRMVIDELGNVGIGETNPTNLLSLKETDNTVISPPTATWTQGPGIFKIQNTSSAGSNVALLSFGLSIAGTVGAGVGLVNTVVSASSSSSVGDLAFYTKPAGSPTLAERMRITSGGSVLIGGITGTPNGTSIYGSGFIPTSNGRKNLNMATSSSALNAHIYFFNPNGAVGYIATNGNSTDYNTSSDYRLKEDLQDFKGLDMISDIPVYNFKWKSDESRSYGVMAHELQEVLPDAVSGEKDATEEYEVTPAVLDEEGNVSEEAIMGTRNQNQGVDYSKVVPLLIKSIQELKAEIELLKAR